MNRRYGAAWGLGLVWVCLTASAAPAQTPSLTQPDSSALSARPALPPSAALLANPQPATADDPVSGWGTDLILGLPTGLRLQKALNPERQETFVLEGVVGLYAVIFPTAGGGVRYRFAPIQGRRDALVLSPGVDGYVLVNPFSFGHGWLSGGPTAIGMVGADVDCAWRHNLGDHCCGELGLKLGGGVAFGPRSSVVLPLVGVFAGFRY